MSASRVFALLEIELRHALEEAAAVEEAIGAQQPLSTTPGLQRIDHLRQHLTELRALLERLCDRAPEFDIASVSEAVSLADMRARLQGVAAKRSPPGELDLF